ncbi:MAG: autotransporter domain-containing protein [Terrimicrobiaceae bacterium]|nr:autotransporter domain-containing protein [Terrimicrobiaceae bacterium]
MPPRKMVAVLGGVLVITAFPVSADTFWTGAVDSDWQKSGNWSDGIPNSGSDAEIISNGPANLSSGNASVAVLRVRGSQAFHVSGGASLSGERLTLGLITPGEMSVSGSGTSAVFSSGPLVDVVVGASASAVLNVSSGALLQTSAETDEFLLGPSGGNGTLNVSSGGIVATVEIEKGSSANINFDGGVFRSISSSANVFQNFSAGEVTLLAGGATFDTNGFNATISTGLGGNGSLTKSGNGTLTMTGNNTYSGNTTVGDGTLRLNGGGAATGNIVSVGNVPDQTGQLQIEGGSTLKNDLSLIGTFGGTGIALVSGNGSQWTNSQQLYVGESGNGSLTVENQGLVEANQIFLGYGESGVLNVKGAGSKVSSPLVVQLGQFSTGTLTVEDGGEFAALGIQIGSGGGVGTINIGSGGAAGILSVDRVTGSGAGSIHFNHTGNVTLAAEIQGNITVTKNGTGTTFLTGNNSFSGGVTVAGGTLSLGSNTAAGTGTITTTGSVIDYADGVTIANPILLNSNDTQLQVLTGSATQSGNISETGGSRPLEKTGNGTLTLSGNNTYTGTTTVGAGTLLLTGGSAISDSGAVVVNSGATLRLDGAETIGSLAGAGSVTLNATLTAGSNNSSTTFSGNSTGSGGLIKTGNGTLTLSGSNSYTGGTTVRNGSLVVSSNGSITHSSANLTVGEASGQSATMSVGSSGSLSAFRGYLGYDGGAAGELEVAGGNATFADELYVGYTGNGTLELSGNGTLANTKAFIGVNSPSVSSANIASGVWTSLGELTVGYGGRGSLEIGKSGSVQSVGAFFGFLAASDGNTGSITGPEASWTSNGTFYLGYDGSDNALEVLLGGSLLSGNPDFLIGANAGSGNNTLTVSGNGSTFSNNGTLYVGRSGVGNSMAILAGAEVTNRNVRIGGGSGSNGTTADNFVTVNGTGSMWTIGGTLRVGSSGSNSSLTISNGATVGVTGNSFLGYDASSDDNAVNVTGNGSTWSVSSLTIGRAGGNNTVTVAEGGNLTASTGILLADQSGSSGTLRIGNNGTAGSVSAPQITGGNGTAVVEFLHTSSDLEFTPVLAGTLSVRHAGSGTTTLTGNNTFTGGTTVADGVLRTSNASALGAGPVTLDAGTLDPVGTLNIASLTWNGGTIASDLGTTTDLLGISGNLTLSGTGGEFVFTDAAGFTPNTTYTILSAANLGDFLPTQFSGSALLGLSPTFTRSGTNLLVSYIGASDGPLLQNNGGPWTPTTANFLVDGPVQTGNATASNTVNSLIFNPDGTLRVRNNLRVTSGNFLVNDGTGTIEGGNVIVPGLFTKGGLGTLFANSNFQIGGPGTVGAGALFINGRFIVGGGLTVFQNALLGGNGTIIGHVINRGTVNPGNSPGTLSIVGDFTQTSSGTLQLEIASPTVFDRLIVSGTANLGGTLQVLNLGNRLQYGQRYGFLQAGRISGQFDEIEMPQPGTFRGRFLAQDGSLIVAPTSYTLVAVTPNQRRVAKALDDYISATSGDKLTVSTALDLQSEDQYPASFDQIAPGFYQTLTQTAINQAFTQTQMINQRLNSVRLGAGGFQAMGLGEQPLKHDTDGKSTVDAKNAKNVLVIPTRWNWSTWAMATGIFSRTQGLAGVPNYRTQSGGFLAGVDYLFGEPGQPNLRTGLYGGYNYTAGNYANGSSTQTNAALFGAYASYTQGGFYADAVVGGSYNAYQARRSIEFSTIDRTARSSPDGGTFLAAINLGHDWEADGFTFGPIAGLQYTYAGVAPFSESGAESLDLRLSQQNTNSLMMTLGGRVAYTWNLSQTITLIPEIRMFWQHEFLQNPTLIGASLNGGGGPGFNYETETPDRDSIFAGAGLSAQFGERWNAFFYYNTSFGNQQYLNHSISAGLGWKF